MKKLLIAMLITAAAGNGVMAGSANAAPPPPPPLPKPAPPPPLPKPVAAPLPANSDNPDNRIRILTYSDDSVYPITTKYGYQTNIVFGKNEQIQTISVGDRTLWQLIPAGNRLFIRPMVYGIQTNMTLITDKHSYQFDLKSVPTEKSGGNIYVARFIYPDNQANRMAAFPPASLLAQAALNQLPARLRPEPATAPERTIMHPAASPSFPASSRPLNYNYTYTGPDAAAPLQAYDDGRSTFIQYREDQPLPSVYTVDTGGNKQSVSYDVDNDLIVVDKVAGEWLLEENNGIVHLYNEMLNSK